VRPRPIKRPPKQEPLPAGEAEVAEAAESATEVAADEANAPPRLNLPASAGEPAEPDEPNATDDDDRAELAKLVRPAAGTVAKGAADDSGDHG
jgi:hypothetical protein